MDRSVMLRALPWIAILLIIGTVQLIRNAPVDSVIFAVVAVLVALDAAGVLPQLPVVRVPLGAIVVGGALAAVLLALAPRHGLLAGIVVGAVGIAAVAIAWSRPAPPERAAAGPSGRLVLRGAVLWASVTIVLCLWELSSFLLGRFDAVSKLAHPAISDLLDPAVDTSPGRIAFAVLWVAAGVGLVRVGRSRSAAKTRAGARSKVAP